MKKKIFLLFATLVFALVLTACNLTSKDIELAATVTYNPEMAEDTVQLVTVEVTDKSLDVIFVKSLIPLIFKISAILLAP